jgi:hypothetical protein
MKQRLILLLVCLVSMSKVSAIDNLTLQLGSIAGTGWQAEEVAVQWQWLNEKKMALTLEIATLTLPTLKKPLQKLRVQCSQTEYSTEQIACPRAKLQLGGEVLDKPAFELSFTYLVKQQSLDLRINEIAVAGGKVTSQVKSVPAGWQAYMQLNGVDFEKILNTLGTFMELPGFSLGGSGTLKVTLSGQTSLAQVNLEGEATGLKYSNSAGSQSGENLGVQIAVKASQSPPSPLSESESKKMPTVDNKGKKVAANKGENKVATKPAESQGQWQVAGGLTVKRGEVYSDPIYINVSDQPVTVAVDCSWQSHWLNIHSFAYSHPTVGTLQGFGSFAIGEEFAVKTLTLQLSQSSLKQFYSRYLQSWLGDNQEFSGTMDGRLEWDQDNRQWQANLHEVNIEDKNKKFGVKGINGLLQWHSQRTDLPSQLHWSSAYLLSTLKLGASDLQVSYSGNRLKLLAPWSQPILDGAVSIEKFNLENLGKEDMLWELRGTLHPIAMQTLSTALGGPALNGQLSGEIPPILYKNKQLNLKGDLRMRVFEGDVVVHALSILFGSVPELTAAVEVNKINLKTLTKVTEFGEIQGHLSGYVRQLHLVNWQPVSFDAYFATPEDNALPRKISQTAVNNLSKIGGGGVVNALSQGVLQFFENFSYERIGWGCFLQQGICQMRGAESTANGYYIVKGGGLPPRIDVIGYNQKVDWEELLNRLKRVSHIKAPQVK